MTRRPPADLNIVASYYKRWAPHEDKRRDIAEDHKVMFAEAKSEGLNPKALRKAFAEQYRVENQTADQAEKRNETDGDVELYLLALARVREDEPEHDADGAIIEREVPATVAAVGASPATLSAAAAQAANANVENDDVATPPAHAPEQPGKDHGSVSTPDEGGADSSEIHPSEAALLPQTGAGEALVDQSQAGDGNARPVPVQGAAEFVPSDPLRSDAANGNEAGAVAPDHSKPNPICRDPGDCGVYASWHLPCLSCTRAAQARAA